MTDEVTGTGLDGLSLKQLADAYNAIAQKNPETMRPIVKFSDRASGVKKLSEAQAATGERIIHLMEPTYIKRGSAAARFPFYVDGMLVSDFVKKCTDNGHTVAAAKRDIRHDSKRGLIKVV